MKYELYINNHEYEIGIEDYILSIKKIFAKNGFNIKVVNKISEDVEILFVIENFVKIPKELPDVLTINLPSRDIFDNPEGDFGSIA